MRESFFNENNLEKRVALENKSLRERCQSVLQDASEAPQICDEMTENMLKVKTCLYFSHIRSLLSFRNLILILNLIKYKFPFLDYCDKRSARCN